MGLNPQNHVCRAVDARAHPLHPQVQIRFWASPTASWMHRNLWGVCFYQSTRDSACFNKFKVSTSCSIDIFYYISCPFSFILELILVCFWVTYMPNMGPWNSLWSSAMIGELFQFLQFTPHLKSPWQISLFLLQSELYITWKMAGIYILDTVDVFGQVII